jgi:hypothetical protein
VAVASFGGNATFVKYVHDSHHYSVWEVDNSKNFCTQRVWCLDNPQGLFRKKRCIEQFLCLNQRAPRYFSMVSMSQDIQAGFRFPFLLPTKSHAKPNQYICKVPEAT